MQRLPRLPQWKKLSEGQGTFRGLKWEPYLEESHLPKLCKALPEVAILQL